MTVLSGLYDSNDVDNADNSVLLTQNGYYHGSTLVPVVVTVLLTLYSVGC